MKYSIFCVVPIFWWLCWLTPRKCYESKQHVTSNIETVTFTTKIEKLTPDSLQWLLGPTQSDHSSLSHSFPVILCRVYSSAAILVFLLGFNIPIMPCLCMVHSLPLLRLFSQCQQRLFLTTFSNSIPPAVCVALSH